MATEIPVYLFTGFLESGKTKTIQETLADEGFNTGERTLLLMCEDGIEEYEPSEFAGKNVFIEEIESEDELTEKTLRSLAKKHKVERVVIEYNGMWQLSTLYDAVPSNWLIYQQLLFADATTFENYNNNMRSLVVDKLQNCELVVFNRPDKSVNKDTLHKIVRGVSRRTSIAYEYPDGTLEYDEQEDPLPFDINSPVITIADRDYALWFRDFAEDIRKYSGKTVKFKGIVGINKNMKPGVAICGRHVMTCCIDDIEFKGLVCVDVPDNTKLSNRDWVIMTARIEIEHHELYGKKGPVLHALEIEKSSAPEQEIATFY
ncbi:MAG: GTPase [Ruminococcaceae bacterium]|nr:GTPase [Oscillospiraceae bacterium]